MKINPSKGSSVTPSAVPSGPELPEEEAPSSTEETQQPDEAQAVKAEHLFEKFQIAHPLFRSVGANKASKDESLVEDDVDQQMEDQDELDEMAREPLHSALAVLASGDLEAGREELAKIRAEFPEAEAIVSRMEADRRDTFNGQVLEVWKQSIDENEAAEIAGRNSGLGRALDFANQLASGDSSDPIERCRAKWNESRELMDAVAERLRSGESETPLAALEVIAEEGAEGLQARAEEILEQMKDLGRGKGYRGNAIGKLVGYAASVESGDLKAASDFAERLYEDADNLSILDGSVQTAHNLFSVLAAHSDDPELVADCKERIREIETGNKSVARIIQEEIRTIGTDDLVTMAMMGGAAKIGTGVTLRSLQLLEKAGVAAGKARWVALALGFGAETNAIWGMNTLRQAATGNASQVFDKEQLARSYAANLISMGFLKGSGAIGKRLAASSPRLSGVVSHGSALGGMIAGNQVAGAMRLTPEHRGGTKEAIVKDVFQYFKYAAGPKVFDKMKSAVASSPVRRTPIEIKPPRFQGVPDVRPEPASISEPVRNFGTLPGLGGPLPQEGKGGVERTGRGYEEATTPRGKAGTQKGFVGTAPKPVELDLQQVRRDANAIIEFYDHPKTQETLQHFLRDKGALRDSAKNAGDDVTLLRQAVEDYTRLSDALRIDPNAVAADKLPLASQNMVRLALRVLHSPFDRMLTAHAARVGRLESELLPLKRSLAVLEVQGRHEGRPTVLFAIDAVRPEADMQAGIDPENPERSFSKAGTRDLVKIDVSVADAQAGQGVLDRLRAEGFLPSDVAFEGTAGTVNAEVPCRRIEGGRVVTGTNRVAVTIRIDADLSAGGSLSRIAESVLEAAEGAHAEIEARIQEEMERPENEERTRGLDLAGQERLKAKVRTASRAILLRATDEGRHEFKDVEIIVEDGEVAARALQGRLMLNGPGHQSEYAAGVAVYLEEGDTVLVDGTPYARIQGELRRVPGADLTDENLMDQGTEGMIFRNADGTLTKVVIPNELGIGLDGEHKALAYLDHIAPRVGLEGFAPSFHGRPAPDQIVIGRVSGTELGRLSADTRRSIPSTAWERLFSDIRKMNEAGLSHNDITPRNIFWDGQRLRLIDFGAAEIGTIRVHARSGVSRDFYMARSIFQKIRSGVDSPEMLYVFLTETQGRSVPVADTPFALPAAE